MLLTSDLQLHLYEAAACRATDFQIGPREKRGRDVGL